MASLVQREKDTQIDYDSDAEALPYPPCRSNMAWALTANGPGQASSGSLDSLETTSLRPTANEHETGRARALVKHRKRSMQVTAHIRALDWERLSGVVQIDLKTRDALALGWSEIQPMPEGV